MKMIESLLNEAEFVSASKGGKEWTCCWWQASVTGLQARVLSADSQKSNTEWVPYGFSDYSWITSLRFDSHWFPVALTFCLSSTVEVCTLSKMLFKRHTHKMGSGNNCSNSEFLLSPGFFFLQNIKLSSLHTLYSLVIWFYILMKWFQMTQKQKSILSLVL